MKRVTILFLTLLFCVSCFAQIKTFNKNPNVSYNKTATNPTWQWLEGKWMMMGFVKNNVLLTESDYNATTDSLKKMLRNEGIAKDSAKVATLEMAQKLTRMLLFSMTNFKLSFIDKDLFILDFFDMDDINDDLSVSAEDIETYTGTYKIMPKQKLIMLYTADTDKPIILDYQVYGDKLQIHSKNLFDGVSVLLEKQ